MSRADEYRLEFNKLERLLRTKAKANEYIELNSVIKELVNIKKDRVVINFQQDLREYLELRNAIVHQTTNRAIAEPYRETIDALIKLRYAIEKPKTASNIATNNLFTATLTDRVSDVIKLMSKNNITSTPILENGLIIGFFSEKTALRLMANKIEDDGIAIEVVTISDIDLDSIYGDDSDAYDYVAQDVSVYEIEDYFARAIRDNKRLMALIVTHSGTHKEKPLGVITAWDLYK